MYTEEGLALLVRKRPWRHAPALSLDIRDSRNILVTNYHGYASPAR